MSKVHLTQCPVCRETAFSHYLTCKDYSVSKEEFQLQQCDSCGFIFTQDAPSEDTIGPYYESEDYISHSDTRQGLVNRLYHTARTFMLRSKQRLVTQVVG
ncbi:MAG: hypothetical protein AAGB22_08410, partial [Bacteroidota bacterium]